MIVEGPQVVLEGQEEISLCIEVCSKDVPKGLVDVPIDIFSF